MVRYRRQPSEGEPAPLDPNDSRPRKRRRSVALLPAMFTLGNCLCGFTSIHYAAPELRCPRPSFPLRDCRLRHLRRDGL